MISSDLFKIFKVEYDKANVISSYPSFLTEEIEIFLNKGYLTTVSRKFSGNNVRKIGFEGDVAATSDLQNLITTVSLTEHTNVGSVNNAIKFNIKQLPLLYFVSARLTFSNGEALECMLTNHDIYKSAAETTLNKPWLPNPVCVLESDGIVIYYDTLMNPKTGSSHSISTLQLTYCKQPNKISYLASDEIEVSDILCSEIISLAVYYALETIESQRVQTKSEDIKIIE